MNDNKKKKKYVSPLLEVVHNESEETMLELSEWEEEPGPGFVITEEDKNHPKDDESWGAKENGFLDNGDDFFDNGDDFFRD